jgi:heme-degrading monooxygenase HmoA
MARAAESGADVRSGFDYPAVDNEAPLPVLVRHNVVGMDTAAYDQVSPGLIELLKKQPGFILHVAYPNPEGVTVSEIWEGREQHDKWFDENVKANVQGEIKQEVIELHNIVEA